LTLLFNEQADNSKLFKAKNFNKQEFLLSVNVQYLADHKKKASRIDIDVVFSSEDLFYLKEGKYLKYLHNTMMNAFATIYFHNYLR